MYDLNAELTARDCSQTCGLRRRCHRLGTRCYGRLGWDGARHRLIRELTGGRTESMNDLDVGGLRRLLELIETAPQPSTLEIRH